ncbi:FbpB family small basic protein [Rossellomorea vietnamensis]|uniref:FbpB family small basic protein n=1 Tax=Rossellomorea vietnamensis TaxID=218284 RepID=A0A5D4K633_9BACI|nr:FbpB family small basic protein [Rossellomorea vietnamensis]TYR72754.1 FbpB family small basic protein [Rossellomorea vietnamensis]
MRKPRKKSFADLVNENKQALMMDAEAINAIEEKIESRLEIKRMDKAE